MDATATRMSGTGAIGASASAATRSAGAQRGGAGAFTIDMHDIPGLRFPDDRTTLSVALAAFKAEARKTPTERCREQVMKEWHVTAESVAAMPPDEARHLEARIEAEVTRRLHAEADRRPAPEAGEAWAASPSSPDYGGTCTLDALLARSPPATPPASGPAGR